MADLNADDLGADIMAAMETTGTEPSGTNDGAAPPSGDTPSPAETSEGGRGRDEKGRFAPKAEEKQDQAKDAKQPTIIEAGAAPAQPSPDAKEENIPPPVHWKGSAKIEWGRLPHAVKLALTDDISGHTKSSSELEDYRSAIGDRAQILAAQYGTVGNGLKSILAGADMANKNPGDFIRWLAQRSGIDLSTLAQGDQGMQGQPAQGQPHSGYQPTAVERELAELKQTLTGFLQQQQQTQSQTLKSQIDAFAADPSHPYFQDVKADMAILLEKGRAATLNEAYDMAVRMNPSTWKSLLEDQRKKDAEENAKRVEAAKKAGGSLNGAPGSQSPSSAQSNETLEDVLRREMDARFAA